MEKITNAMKNFLTFILLTTLFCSCGQTNSSVKQTADTTIKDNISTTFSEDTAKLGRLIDLSIYKPTSVKFKYTFIDNSGKSERLSVPGPSDYSLQAVLYFDSLTFEKFYAFDRNADYSPPNYNKSEFMFDWLDTDILTELENANPNYHGHPDFFFGSKGKAWYLHGKILISKWTK